MKQLWNRFKASQTGVALIEFVIVLPFLLLLFMGTMELARYSLTTIRVQKAAYVLTDIITQYQNGQLTRAELQTVLEKTQNIVGGDNDKRIVIISSIQQKGEGKPTINWQDAGGGVLTTDVVSAVSNGGPCSNCNAGNDAQLDQYSREIAGLREGENIIVGEVYYRYEPMAASVLEFLGASFAETTVSRKVFMTPRFTPLTCLSDTGNCDGSCTSVEACGTVADGSTCTLYTTQTAACGSKCFSETGTCKNGSFEPPFTTGQFASCTEATNCEEPCGASPHCDGTTQVWTNCKGKVIGENFDSAECKQDPQCIPNWQVVSDSGCSEACGAGKRTIVKKDGCNNTDTQVVDCNGTTCEKSCESPSVPNWVDCSVNYLDPVCCEAPQVAKVSVSSFNPNYNGQCGHYSLMPAVTVTCENPPAQPCWAPLGPEHDEYGYHEGNSPSRYCGMYYYNDGRAPERDDFPCNASSASDGTHPFTPPAGWSVCQGSY